MRLSPRRAPGRWFLSLALAAAVCAAGCGGGSASVSGEVTYDGKPLPGGNITFVSTEGRGGGSATLDPSGKYTIVRLPAGTYRVSVVTSTLKPGIGMTKPKNYAPPAGASNPAGYKPPENEDMSKRYVPIHADYESEKSSGLEFKVKAGANTINIPLAKK
jgi:hypothetical protein